MLCYEALADEPKHPGGEGGIVTPLSNFFL